MTQPIVRKPRATPAVNQQPGRFSAARLREPSTWGGILAVAAAIASGGTTVLADPLLLSQVAAGLGMIFTKEG